MAVLRELGIYRTVADSFWLRLGKLFRVADLAGRRVECFRACAVPPGNSWDLLPKLTSLHLLVKECASVSKVGTWLTSYVRSFACA